MEDILYVVNNSENVKINEDKVKELANKIESSKYKHWYNTDELFNSLSTNENILFVFILESLNFCFWPNYQWIVEYKGNSYHGSDSLLYSLTKAVESKKIILDIDELYKVSQEDFIKIFECNKELPIMMEERYKSFRNVIETIHNKGFNNFINDLYNVRSSKDLEEYIVNNFETYDDKCEYKGRTIHFNKRCRLLIIDLFYTNKTIHNNIGNIDNLLGCADYRIPQYLHDKGIFTYSDKLTEKIINKELIPYGSYEEIEIRANTLCVLEMIKSIIKETNPTVTTAEIDNALWRMSRSDKTDFIHHTMSIYY